MSMTPQGHGWWQASDGRWYPPQAQPGGAWQGGEASAPGGFAPGGFPPGPSAPGGFAPGGFVKSGPGGVPGPPGFGAVPPRKSGFPKALIVLAVVVVALVVGGYAVVSWAMGKVTDNVIGGDCDLVSADDLNGALDGDFELIQLGGLTSIATPVLDSRVLADGTTCWGTENGTETPRLVRVAMLETGDAASRFQQERTLALGVKEDRGGGLSVESQPYFNRDVSFGDEAFCTTTDFTGSSGVLVRRGDTLVYVSLTSGAFTPEFVPDAGGAIKSADDDTHCDLAQRIADDVG